MEENKNKQLDFRLAIGLIIVAGVVGIGYGGICTAILSEVLSDPSYEIMFSEEEYTLNCALDRQGDDEAISCDSGQIKGVVASTRPIEIKADGEGQSELADGVLTLTVPGPEIPSSFYETDAYSQEKLLEAYGQKHKAVLSIENQNGKKIGEKDVSYKWIFSDEVLAVINEKHDAWKEAQFLRDQQTSVGNNSTPYSNGSSLNSGSTSNAGSNSSSNSNSGSSKSRGYSSNTQERVAGYCKDGTPVVGVPSARGRANDCYGHGGWQDQY